MSFEVIHGDFQPNKSRAPTDLAQKLRDWADAVDRGEITGMTGICVRDGDYVSLFGCTWADALVMSTLLQANTLGHFKA